MFIDIIYANPHQVHQNHLDHPRAEDRHRIDHLFYCPVHSDLLKVAEEEVGYPVQQGLFSMSTRPARQKAEVHLVHLDHPVRKAP
jgi:hypothetical protein